MRLEHGRVGRAVVPFALVALSLAGLSGQQDGAILEDPRAKDLFTAARIAVFGGPGGIARLHAMRFKGRSRFPGDDGTPLDATVEIRVLLPDHYLRIDTGKFGRRVTGSCSMPSPVCRSGWCSGAAIARS